MKFVALILSLSLFAALAGCGETEAEKQAKKIDAFKKAMSEKASGRSAKPD